MPPSIPPAPSDRAAGRPASSPTPPRPSARDGKVLVVPTEAKGMRLDRFLAEAFPKRSRQRWMALVKDGAVRVDGVRAKAGTILRGEERLVLPPADGPDAPRAAADEPTRTPRHDGAIEVLYRDADLLVVSKPAGVPCHAGAGLGAVKTLLELMKADVLAGFGLAHRLDRDTSGVIALVRGPELRAKAAAEFAKDDAVEKVYDALVEASPPDESGLVDLPLADPGHGTKARVDWKYGKPAQTEYAVVERFVGATRLRVTLKTGRTHQIRVHLAAIGAPLLVDPLYGARKGWRMVDPKGGHAARLTRTPLHASTLVMTHPSTGKRMTFHAPLFPDHRRALEVLRVIAARGGGVTATSEPIAGPADGAIDTAGDVDEA